MYNYRVSENRLLTPSVRLITLVRKDATLKPLLYQPGQYAGISLHDRFRPTTTRCFSLVSSPTQGDVLQFSIRVKGVYTSALERLEKGDKILVRGPFGNFVFNEHVHGNVVFFAGGIGIAPFISMIRYASDIHAKSKIHLVYSCRNEQDIPFFEELKNQERTNSNIHVTYIVGTGSVSAFKGLRALQGTLNEDTLDTLGLEYSKETYMVCGPPLYMEAVQKLLKNKGVERTRILSEAFGQTASKQSSKLVHWPVNTYALTGLLLLLSTGLIVGTDINKTLPKLETKDIVIKPESSNRIILGDGTLESQINAILPTVDTNTEQEPVITYIPNPKNTEPNPTTVPVTPSVVAPAPKPVVTPTPPPKPKPVVVTKPAPTPTPVVTTKTPPKSTVS